MVFESLALYTLNGLSKDTEVKTPLFEIRRLGLETTRNPCLLRARTPCSLTCYILNKEAKAPLSSFRDLCWLQGISATSRQICHCPRGNKRCFLNGVFQSGMFRGWPGSARAEGTKMIENTSLIGHSLSL